MTCGCYNIVCQFGSKRIYSDNAENLLTTFKDTSVTEPSCSAVVKECVFVCCLFFFTPNRLYAFVLSLDCDFTESQRKTERSRERERELVLPVHVQFVLLCKISHLKQFYCTLFVLQMHSIARIRFINDRLHDVR